MSGASSGGFRAVDQQLLFRGSVVSLYRSVVEGPSGQRFERDVLRHPGAVIVAPIHQDRVLLVRQYRAAVDGELLELPAGKRDVPGEEPRDTARRELREEIGRTASSMKLLASFYNSPGFCDEFSHCYMATGLQQVPHSPQGPEEAAMSLVDVRLADTPAMIASGEIVDAKTIIGITLARAALGR
ncbi:MAG: NUDIX hydrolase [Actinomycetota bacterium]|nr:NUDIX hydrolase [Actinomycetota bacterium]